MTETQEKLFASIDQLLDGYEIDDAIPVLTIFLAQAGHLSGKEKKKFISFIVESIDDIYSVKLS